MRSVCGGLGYVAWLWVVACAVPVHVLAQDSDQEPEGMDSSSAAAQPSETTKPDAGEAERNQAERESSAPLEPLPPELDVPRAPLPKSRPASPRRSQNPKQGAPTAPPAADAKPPPSAEPPPSLDKEPKLGLDGHGLPLDSTFWQASPQPLTPAQAPQDPDPAEVDPTVRTAPAPPEETERAPGGAEEPSEEHLAKDGRVRRTPAGSQAHDEAAQARDVVVEEAEQAAEAAGGAASEANIPVGDQSTVEASPRKMVPPLVGPEPSGSFASEVRAFVEALTSLNRNRIESDPEIRRRIEPAPDAAPARRYGPGFQSPLPVPACVAQDGEDQGTLVSLLLTILLVWFALAFVRRLKRGLAARGVLPFALAALGGLLRVGLALLLVLWIGRLFPASVGPLLPWLTVAMAIGVGWSLRDPAADVFAWAVFVVERRIRPGVWISGQDFAGTVEALRLRSTYIRAQDGQRYSIENRKLLRGPLLCDTLGAAERELTVRVTARAPSNLVRRALHDAVLLSPYIHTGGVPVITQDPVKPSYWHIRARLLDPTYGEHFSGEILERVEETLAALGRPVLVS